MPIRIRISTAQAHELADIRDAELGALHAAHDELKDAPLFPTVEGLYQIISRHLPEQAARSLTRQVISMSLLCRQRHTTPADAMTSFRRALADVGWPEDAIRAWDEHSDIVRDILSLGPVVVAAKAVDLSFDYANLLTSSAILTDLRPVYDDSHDNILSIIISNILRISYTSEDGGHGISLAMTEKDIRLLRRSCDEALKKIEVAKHKFSELMEGAIMMAGEEIDVFHDD